jgi:hypothetical protein
MPKGSQYLKVLPMYSGLPHSEQVKVYTGSCAWRTCRATEGPELPWDLEDNIQCVTEYPFFKKKQGKVDIFIYPIHEK